VIVAFSKPQCFAQKKPPSLAWNRSDRERLTLVASLLVQAG